MQAASAGGGGGGGGGGGAAGGGEAAEASEQQALLLLPPPPPATGPGAEQLCVVREEARGEEEEERPRMRSGTRRWQERRAAGGGGGGYQRIPPAGDGVSGGGGGGEEWSDGSDGSNASLDSGEEDDDDEEEDAETAARRNSHTLRWVVLLLSSIATFGDYYVYDIPSALHNQMRERFEGTNYEDNFEMYFNLLYTVYSIPNTMLPFLGGYFVDTIGIRIMLVLFCSIIMVGQIIVTVGVVYTNMPIILIGRVVFGLGGESLMVGQSALVSVWFKGKELALALALNLSLSRFGSVVNDWYSPYMANKHSIAVPFWVGTLTTVISLFAALALVFLDRVVTSSSSSTDEGEDADGASKALATTRDAKNGASYGALGPATHGSINEDGHGGGALALPVGDKHHAKKETHLAVSLTHASKVFDTPHFNTHPHHRRQQHQQQHRRHHHHRRQEEQPPRQHQRLRDVERDGGEFHEHTRNASKPDKNASSRGVYATPEIGQHRHRHRRKQQSHRKKQSKRDSFSDSDDDFDDEFDCEARRVDHPRARKRRKGRAQNESKDTSGDDISLGALRTFPTSFWLIVFSTMFCYGAILPFNNIASALLQQDYFSVSEPQDDDAVDPSAVRCNTPSTLVGLSPAWQQYCADKSASEGTAGIVQSIPYTLSALLSPFIGILIDRFGYRTAQIFVAPLMLFFAHMSLAFRFAGPIWPLVGIGIAYSIFAAVIWPSTPLVVDITHQGTAFGVLTVFQNFATAVIPIIVAALFDVEKDYAYPELFFAAMAGLGILVATWLLVEDERTGAVLRKTTIATQEDDTSRSSSSQPSAADDASPASDGSSDGAGAGAAVGAWQFVPGPTTLPQRNASGRPLLNRTFSMPAQPSADPSVQISDSDRAYMNIVRSRPQDASGSGRQPPAEASRRVNSPFAPGSPRASPYAYKSPVHSFLVVQSALQQHGQPLPPPATSTAAPAPAPEPPRRNRNGGAAAPASPLRGYGSPF